MIVQEISICFSTPIRATGTAPLECRAVGMRGRTTDSTGPGQRSLRMERLCTTRYLCCCPSLSTDDCALPGRNPCFCPSLSTDHCAYQVWGAMAFPIRIYSCCCPSLSVFRLCASVALLTRWCALCFLFHQVVCLILPLYLLVCVSFCPSDIVHGKTADYCATNLRFRIVAAA